jgi:hypothetical protein
MAFFKSVWDQPVDSIKYFEVKILTLVSQLQKLVSTGTEHFFLYLV